MKKIISEKTELKELTISGGDSLCAPEGMNLIMAVDGVETPIREGSYKGSIVLQPVAPIDVVHFAPTGDKVPFNFRAAVCVEDGAVTASKSGDCAVSYGEVTDSGCSNVEVTALSDEFNGIYVVNSEYTVENAKMRLIGNGKNDYVGSGAAILAGAGAKVTINNAEFETRGCVRPAICANADGVVTVNNSKVFAFDGTLPEDYGWRWFSSPAPGSVMMECPWMLGNLGNNRGTMLTGSATATYNNCHIRAQGWGALGVDMAHGGRLTVNNCLIESTDCGYGAYADGDVIDTFSGSTVNAADYGVIIGGGVVVLTDETVVNSRRFGVMAHDQGLNYLQPDYGRLVVEKGSEINSEFAAIQIKNASISVEVNGARLNPKNGLLLEVMENDDPFNVALKETLEKDPDADPTVGGMFKPMEDIKYTVSDGNDDIDAVFRNVDLNGDMVISALKYCGLNVRLENAKLNGAITSATAVHDVAPDGDSLKMEESSRLWYLIGMQKATYAPVEGKYEARASLDAESVWTVARTSYLNGLSIEAGAVVKAPEDRKLVMEVDGVDTAIKPGSYAGRISLIVTE